MLGSLTLQSLQMRSWHSVQTSPRPKIRPKDLRQRAHCRSPTSCGRWKPLCFISNSSFFSLLFGTKKRSSGGVIKEAANFNWSQAFTVSSSPPFSLVSHLSAAPSGSCLSHAPAERQNPDPPRAVPWGPQSKYCQWNQPSGCMRGLQTKALQCHLLSFFSVILLIQLLLLFNWHPFVQRFLPISKSWCGRWSSQETYMGSNKQGNQWNMADKWQTELAVTLPFYNLVHFYVWKALLKHCSSLKSLVDILYKCSGGQTKSNLNWRLILKIQHFFISISVII